MAVNNSVDPAAWLAEQIQAHDPELTPSMVKTMAEALCRLEPTSCAGPPNASAAAGGPMIATATAGGSGTLAPTPSTRRSPSAPGIVLSRVACWTAARVLSAAQCR